MTKIYGIGHAMVDVFAKVDEGAALEPPLVAGGVAHVAGGVMRALLQKLEGCICERMAGGTAANILKTAACLGAGCFFSGTTGCEVSAAGAGLARDENALFFQKELAGARVEGRLKTAADATGVFLKVDVPNRGAALCASPSAAKRIEARQIEEAQARRADFVVVEGMLALNDAAFARVCDLCERFSRTLVIDAASVFAAKALGTKLAWLKSCAGLRFIVFANQDESLVLKNALLSASAEAVCSAPLAASSVGNAGAQTERFAVLCAGKTNKANDAVVPNAETAQTTTRTANTAEHSDAPNVQAECSANIQVAHSATHNANAHDVQNDFSATSSAGVFSLEIADKTNVQAEQAARSVFPATSGAENANVQTTQREPSDAKSAGGANVDEQNMYALFTQGCHSRILMVEKRGKDGACAWQNGAETYSPAANRNAFDATGAGDAFAGAFLCAWHKRRDLAQSLAFANQAAAAVLGVNGCALSPQAQSELKARLAEL